MSLYQHSPEMAVSTVKELLARCEMAKQLKLSESADRDDPIRILCLPLPHKATNEQIDTLKPLYHELLPNTNLLRPLEHSPEEAIMFSYILAYPSFVRMAREDQGINIESFLLFDILEKIATDEFICTWCRETLKDTTTPSSVFGSSVVILKQSLYTADKAHVIKTVFGGKDNTAALDELQRDIEQTVNRNDLHGEDVAVCTDFFFRACMYLKGGAAGGLEMAERGSAFHGALRRTRKDLSEDVFRHQAMITGMQMNPIDLLTAFGAVTVDDRKPTTAICDADGCHKVGEKVCALCGLATYCGKRCQTVDWKARHKHSCGGRKPGHSSKANRKKSSKKRK